MSCRYLQNTIGIVLAGWFCCHTIHAEIPKEDAKMKEGAKVLYVADAFRTEAMTNSVTAVLRYATDPFAKKWKDQIVSRFKGNKMMVVSDFFAHASILPGSYENGQCILGYYSPWSDMVLLVFSKTAGEGVAIFQDFIFVSGESFRGETVSDSDQWLSLYHPKHPLFFELVTRYALVEAAFNRYFPLDQEVPLIPKQLKNKMKSVEEELAVFVFRQTYRMDMYAHMVKPENDQLRRECGKFLRLVARDVSALAGYLSAKQRPAVLKTVDVLPEKLRNGFAPAYSVQAKDGAVVCYVNPSAPLWVLIVSYKGEIQEKTATLEVLDLSKSGNVYKLLKGGRQ